MTQRLYLAGKGLSEARRITTGGNDESEGRIEAIQFPPANRFKVRSIRWTQAIKREAATHRCLMHPLYSPPSKIIIKMFHGRRMLGGVPLVCSERIQDG